MKKYNFFKILFSVCSGTKIFPEIINNSIFRVLFHLFLISVLCSLLYIVPNTPALKKNINDLNIFLNKEFGGIVVKKDGVYPEKAPNKARSYNYSFIKLDYYPDLPQEKEFEINDKLNRVGILWQPNSLVGWLKTDSTNFFVYQGMITKNQASMFSFVNKKGIYSYLKATQIFDFSNGLFAWLCTPLAGDFPVFLLYSTLKPGINSFSDFTGSVYLYSAGIVALSTFLMIFVNSVFIALLYAAFFSIFARNVSGEKQTFKNRFNLIIYAGFPAIVIGILFTIAKIPWGQYQTYYMIALFIYLLVINQKLQRVK